VIKQTIHATSHHEDDGNVFSNEHSLIIFPF